jgi:S-DNA-T family DNA segregation ATPase FtsK/SpoIIIE
VVVETNQASVSVLQRRLRLGYSRAARLIDIMEQNGIVGPYAGSKARDILIDREKWLVENMGQPTNDATKSQEQSE